MELLKSPLRSYVYVTPTLKEGKPCGETGAHKEGIKDSFSQLFTPSLFGDINTPTLTGGHNVENARALPHGGMFEDDALVPGVRRGQAYSPAINGMGLGLTPVIEQHEREQAFHDIQNEFYANFENRVVPTAHVTPKMEEKILQTDVVVAAKEKKLSPRKPASAVVSVEPVKEVKKEKPDPKRDALTRELQKKTREAAIVRWKQKRRERLSGKHIRYTCRKKLADARPRVKGRFVKSEDMLQKA